MSSTGCNHRLSGAAIDTIISSKDSGQSKLARELLRLDRDVFAVAVFGFDGSLEAYVAKEFFAKEYRKESSIWEKIAVRHAAILRLANEGELDSSSASGIVFFRKSYKQILIPIPSRRIIIEAVMPLWNHSTVFFEGVHKFFALP